MRRAYISAVLILLVTVVIALIANRPGPNPETAPKEPYAMEPKPTGISRSWSAGLNQSELEYEIAKWSGELHRKCRNPYPMQARLSLLFQEWGFRDVDAALRFLDSKRLRALLDDNSIVRPREALSYSAIIGYSGKNPSGAWQRLLNLLNQRNEKLIRNGAYLRPWIDESAAESIFRTWYKSKPEEALQALRDHEDWFHITHEQLIQGVDGRSNEWSLLLGSALRVVMAETKDSAQRQNFHQEFVVGNSDILAEEVGVALAGVFEQDPMQAWKWAGVDGVDWGNRSKFGDPHRKIYHAIMMWSYRDPVAARDFLNGLGSGDHQPLLFDAYMFGQLQKRPELLVDLLDSPAFSNFKKTIVHPEFIIEQWMNENLSWPVAYDGETQPDFLSRLQSLEKAFERSTFSDESKQAVKEVSENARIQYLEKKDCAH